MQNINIHSRTSISILRFPDGDVKISGSFKPSPSIGPKVKREPLTELERQEKAAKRAGTQIRDLAKYHNLGYLLTLTYRGAITDRSRVMRDFKRFQRLVREQLPDFSCVAVFEYHLGGGVNDHGIHIHMATDRFFPVEVLRAAWWSIVGDKQGNIQIEHRSHRDSFRRIASYLGKYLAKGVSDSPRVRGEHRYLRSQNLKMIVEKRTIFSGMVSLHVEALKAELVFMTRGTFYSEWWSADRLCFVLKSYF